VFLAIDTSAGTSVAVVDEAGVVLSEVSTPDTMRHAEVIGRLLADALRDAGVAPSALTAVVAGMGPGPFTGLRVGIAAARVFALGAGVPLLPVVSHDAVAWGERASGGRDRILVVTDARRKELFWSGYDLDPELPRLLTGPGLAKPHALPLDDGPGPLRRVDAATISAGQLGRAAAAYRAVGLPFAEDEAVYLRSPDVTLSSGPKRVTQ
jgi:tRNA threonylcarbamoyl adenosine modification protein YeaZ